MAASLFERSGEETQRDRRSFEFGLKQFRKCSSYDLWTSLTNLWVLKLQKQTAKPKVWSFGIETNNTSRRETWNSPCLFQDFPQGQTNMCFQSSQVLLNRTLATSMLTVTIERVNNIELYIVDIWYLLMLYFQIFDCHPLERQTMNDFSIGNSTKCTTSPASSTKLPGSAGQDTNCSFGPRISTLVKTVMAYGFLGQSEIRRSVTFTGYCCFCWFVGESNILEIKTAKNWCHDRLTILGPVATSDATQLGILGEIQGASVFLLVWDFSCCCFCWNLELLWRLLWRC